MLKFVNKNCLQRGVTQQKHTAYFNGGSHMSLYLKRRYQKSIAPNKNKKCFFLIPLYYHIQENNPCCLERRMPASRFVHFGDVVKFYPISIYLHYRVKMPTCGELREKLASLGLATSGTKAVLEARLHAANVAVSTKQLAMHCRRNCK